MLGEETIEQSYDIDTVHWPVRYRSNGGAKAVCLVAVSLCLGLCTSLIGPCILVLRDELGISIGEISRVFAGHAAGSLIGSFVGVFTSDSPALALLSLLLLAVGVALIAWSNSLLLLAGSFTLQGLAFGVLQTKYDESSSSSAAITCAFHTAFGLGATAVPIAIALLINSQQSAGLFAGPTSLVDGNGMELGIEFQDSNTSTLFRRVRRSANTTDDVSSQEMSVGSVDQFSTTLTFQKTVPTTIPRIKSKKPIADGSQLNSDPKYADGRNARDPIRKNLRKNPSAVEDSGGEIGVASKLHKENLRENVGDFSQNLVTLTTLKPEVVEFPKSFTNKTLQTLAESSTSNLENAHYGEIVSTTPPTFELNIDKPNYTNVTEIDTKNNSESISKTGSKMTQHPSMKLFVGKRNDTFQENSASIFANTSVNRNATSDAEPTILIQSPSATIEDLNVPFQASEVNPTHKSQSASVEKLSSTTTVRTQSSSTSKSQVASVFSSIVANYSPTATGKSGAQHVRSSVTPSSTAIRTSQKPTSFSLLSKIVISGSPKIQEHNAVSQESSPADSLGQARLNIGEQTTVDGEIESVTFNSSSATQKHLVISKKTSSKRTSVNAVYAAISGLIAFTGVLLVFVRILSAKRPDSRGYHTALEQHADQKVERGIARLSDSSSVSCTASLFAVIAILHFFRSGAEWTFTGLMPCFAQSRIGWTRSNSAALTASFWMSFAVGRVASSSNLLSRRISHRSLMVGGLVLGFVAMGVLNISIPQHSLLFAWWQRAGIRDTALVWTSATLLGFGLSLVSSAAEKYVFACGSRCLKFAAVLGSCSGEMVVPLLSGMLSTLYGLDWVVNTGFAAVAGCLAVGLVLWYIAPADVRAKESPSLLVQMLGDSIEAVSRTSILQEDCEDVATDVNEDEEAELLGKNSSSIFNGDIHSVGSHLTSRARMGTRRTPKAD